MDDIKTIIETAGEGEKTPELDQATLERRNLVSAWLAKIKHAEGFHKGAFKRMRSDMDLAFHGYDPELWGDEKYVVNVAQRHVQQRTAALYAKNPKATAKPRPRMMYSVWDEKPETLKMAMLMQTQAEETGLALPATAAALLEEYGQVKERKDQLEKISKSLEILFHYFMQEATPSFKSQMKALVRRMLTTGVGYVKLGFQREMRRQPEVTARMNDVMVRIDHMERLAQEVTDGKIIEGDAELEELRLALTELAAQEKIIVREGLLFDFPTSTAIIVDPLCQQLRGFVGARWIAHKMLFTADEAKEIYKKDLGAAVRAYKLNDKSHDSSRAQMTDGGKDSKDEDRGMVCVYEIYDKSTGNVLVVTDGYSDFLEEPAAPKVTTESFWPVFALVCNEVEHEKEIYPPSDVHLIRSMCHEYNRAREGLREHRRANRPRYISPAGKLEDQDKQRLAAANAHDVIEIQGMAPGEKAEDLVAALKTTGIDPNLYEVSSIFDDVQLAVGSQEAQFGSTSGATATETSVAESSRMSALGAQVDELDTFMTEIARASGAIMLAEMSVQQVKEIVGPGASWPSLTAQEIADEVFLEIEAGSTGKPNQAAEIRNLERVLPYLIQIPGIDPKWLAKQVLKRMDDKLDLDAALAEGVDSIVSMNGGRDANAAMGQAGAAAGAGNAPVGMAPGMGPTGPAQGM